MEGSQQTPGTTRHEKTPMDPARRNFRELSVNSQ